MLPFKIQNALKSQTFIHYHGVPKYNYDKRLTRLGNNDENRIYSRTNKQQ